MRKWASRQGADAGAACVRPVRARSSGPRWPARVSDRPPPLYDPVGVVVVLFLNGEGVAPGFPVAESIRRADVAESWTLRGGFGRAGVAPRGGRDVVRPRVSPPDSRAATGTIPGPDRPDLGDRAEEGALRPGAGRRGGLPLRDLRWSRYDVRPRWGSVRTTGPSAPNVTETDPSTSVRYTRAPEAARRSSVGRAGMAIRIVGSRRRHGDPRPDRVDERLGRCGPAAVMGDLEQVDPGQPASQQ